MDEQKKSNTYDYLYKRKKRVPVKITPYLFSKLAYITKEVNNTYNYFRFLKPSSLTKSQLLDKFEELVDNIDNPSLIKELSDKYDEHNKNRTHFCFPD